MWTELEKVFEEMNYPYARQGSYQEGEVPESTFTFWNVDTPEDGFFDNKANKAIWIWNIYFYTKRADLLYSVIDEFIQKSKLKGFIPQGKAHDIPADEPDYFGRYITLKYVEKYTLESV